MATLQDAIQKRGKKPFVKKEFRSYLSTEEIDRQPYNPPIDKPTEAAISSNSDHVEASDTAPQHHRPVQSERVQPEPVQSQPVLPDSTLSDPGLSDPTPLDSAPLDSGLSDSDLSDPNLSDSPQSDPSHSDSTHTDQDLSDRGLSDSDLSDPSPSDPSLSDPTPADSSLMEQSLKDRSPIDPSPVDSTQTDPGLLDLGDDESNLEELAGWIPIQKGPAYGLLLRLDPYEFKILYFCTLQAFNRGPTYKLKEGLMHAGQGFLSKGTKLSLSTVKRTMAKLEEKKLMVFVREGAKCKGDVYRISDAFIRPLDRGLSDRGLTDSGLKEQPTPVYENGAPRSNRATNKEVKQNKKGESPPSPPPALWLFYSSELKRIRNRDQKYQPHLDKNHCADLVKKYGEEGAKRVVTRYIRHDEAFLDTNSWELRYLTHSKAEFFDKAKDKPKGGSAEVKFPGIDS